MVNFETIHAIAVEDDEGSALLIKAILRRIGIDVHIHSTGENFLDFIHELSQPPNLILLDINLPRRNGIDIIKELRGDSQFSEIKVVAISAVDPNKYIPQIKAAGFDSFIRKPVRREQFPKQIDRILAGEAIWESF